MLGGCWSACDGGRSARPKLSTEQLDRVVDQFVVVARRFDDLEFCNANGVLQLKTPMPRVTSIRIELPGATSLQLKSVIVDGDGLDDPVGQARLTTSKPANPEAAEIIRSKRVLDPSCA